MKSSRTGPKGRTVAWTAVLLLAGAGAVGAATVQDPSWKTVAASGRVEASAMVETADWKRVSRGDELTAESAVRTGRRGRATLARGADILILDPESEVVLPASSRDSVVEQTSGSVLYEVDGRVNPDFKVVTPYLVAGVKGTQFVVTVDDRSASVSVQHGVVEVFDPMGGERLAVRAGEAVLRESGQPTFLRVRPESVDTVHPPSGRKEVASTDGDSKRERVKIKAEPDRSSLAARAPVWFDSWPNADPHGQTARRSLGNLAGDEPDRISLLGNDSQFVPTAVVDTGSLNTTPVTRPPEDDWREGSPTEPPPVSLPPVIDPPIGQPPDPIGIGDDNGDDSIQHINRNP